MSFPIKILIAETENFSSKAIHGLKEIGNVVLKDIEQSDLKNAFSEYNVVWVRLKFTIKENDFPKDCITKYIICPVTGLDHIDLEACAKRNIKVISLKGEIEFLKSVRATAEHTIALTLALLRKLPDALFSVKNGNWKRDLFKGEEIFEKKVGILGVGRLGAITASYFRAFGAKVYGYDIKEFDPSICEKANSMNELFEICDIITIHVDLNPKTKNMIGINQFNKMKNDSFIINTSRGAIVNESELLYALENKLIAGAGIDVLDNEYEITNNALINYANYHNNLLITPHIGGNTKESFVKTELFMLQKLKFFTKNILLLLITFFVNYSCSAQAFSAKKIFEHDQTNAFGHFFYNHTPQLEILDSNSILPNGTKLQNNIFIVSAIAGQWEGEVDQNIWMSKSLDNGKNWSLPDTFGLPEEWAGNNLLWNASLFKLNNNKLVQFYMFQRNRGGGANGNQAIFLRFKTSIDGGVTWNGNPYTNIDGIGDTTTFRIFGPYTKPILLHKDSMFFPLYYRISGNPTAYFATLICDTALTYFRLNKFPAIADSTAGRLIEPTIIVSGDSLKVIFRTASRTIRYIYSTDKGKNWSKVYFSEIKQPSTLFTNITSDSNNFLISNLSSKFRDNLSLIKTTSSLNYNGSKLLDYVIYPMEQVTYPSVAIDRKNEKYFVYSAIGYDNAKDGRFGDIYINKLTFDSVENDNITTLVNKIVPFIDKPVGTNIQFEDTKLVFEKNVIFIFDTKNNTNQSFTISSINTIYSAYFDANYGFLLTTDKGIGQINLTTKVFKILNSSITNGQIKRLNDTLFGHFENRNLKVLDNGLQLLSSITIPSISQFVSWGNITDITYNKSNNIIIIGTDIGHIYQSIYPFNSIQTNFFKVNDHIQSLIFTSTNNLYIGTRRGNILKVTDFILFDLQTIYNNTDYSNDNIKFHEFNSNILIEGATQIININLKNNAFILLKLNPNYDCVSVLKYGLDSITFLNANGDILRIKNINGLNTAINIQASNKNNLNIFPNPIRIGEQLMIDTDYKIESIKIFDLNGKIYPAILNQNNYGQNQSVQTIQLKEGLYFVSILTKEGFNIMSKITVYK